MFLPESMYCHIDSILWQTKKLWQQLLNQSGHKKGRDKHRRNAEQGPATKQDTLKGQRASTLAPSNTGKDERDEDQKTSCAVDFW